MRRLLACAISAVAFAIPANAHAYPRECGGVVDYECHGWVCPTDCWQVECLVWIDVLHNPMTALCIGNPAD